MNNIFADIPEHLEQEIFEQIQTGEHVRIERILSKGHSSPRSGWYDQDWDEWVLLLKGEAVVLLEHQPQVRLGAGDFLNIPAHSRHKVLWTTPHRETIWLAVHYRAKDGKGGRTHDP